MRGEGKEDDEDSTIIFPVRTVKADGVLHPLRTILQFQSVINPFVVGLHIFSVAII